MASSDSDNFGVSGEKGIISCDLYLVKEPGKLREAKSFLHKHLIMAAAAVVRCALIECFSRRGSIVVKQNLTVDSIV